MLLSSLIARKCPAGLNGFCDIFLGLVLGFLARLDPKPEFLSFLLILNSNKNCTHKICVRAIVSSDLSFTFLTIKVSFGSAQSFHSVI